MFHVKFPFITLTLRQFPPTKGLLLKRDNFNGEKLKNLMLNGTSWLRKTRRDWQGASSKLSRSILCDIRLSRYHGLEKTPIPISKVKYCSYPSKNIPYFIHLLSRTRFLQNKWSYATNKRSGATNCFGIYT